MAQQLLNNLQDVNMQIVIEVTINVLQLLCNLCIMDQLCPFILIVHLCLHLIIITLLHIFQIVIQPIMPQDMVINQWQEYTVIPQIQVAFPAVVNIHLVSHLTIVQC